MKYLKAIVGLGLLPLGAFAGSFINIGGGNGAILGSILGVILCCVLFWSHWPGSARLDELYHNNSDKKKQAIDTTMKNIREAHIEEELRYRGLNNRF